MGIEDMWPRPEIKAETGQKPRDKVDDPASLVTEQLRISLLGQSDWASDE
jgi:hypothetical protein